MGKFIPSFSQIHQGFSAFNVFGRKWTVPAFIATAKSSFFVVFCGENTKSIFHVVIAGFGDFGLGRKGRGIGV
jgi:hypothetical protein